MLALTLKSKPRLKPRRYTDGTSRALPFPIPLYSMYDHRHHACRHLDKINTGHFVWHGLLARSVVALQYAVKCGYLAILCTGYARWKLVEKQQY